MDRVELREEKWASVANEIGPLFRAHLEELAPGEEYDLDEAMCEALDAAGALCIISARLGATLIGYCIWTIGPRLEAKGQLAAELKPWYVKPEYRQSTLGLKLFRQSLRALRSRHITRCFPHHWGTPALGDFFTSLGARPVEWVYQLEL